MKKINSLLFIALFSAISFTSCKNDDGPSTSEEEITANAQNELENTSIPLASIASGISIENATVVSGAAPTPNNQVDFNLNSDITEAFQETGLKIQFSSDDSVAGAYIQFKDTDGNATDTYFDVPSYTFSFAAKKDKTSKKSVSNIFKKSESTSKSSKTTEDFTDEIQVDFSSVVPAGEFCYDICLYDSQNNISQIQTVCATVEAWGGNASIVGEWIFDRVEGDIEDTTIIECSNGEEFSANYEQEIKNDYTLVFNADGTYYETYDNEFISLDYNASMDTCSAVYDTDDTFSTNEKYSGNWAYNEEEETLTVIDFKYENFLNPEYNEEYENGILYFEGVFVEVISGQLVLSEIEDGQEIFKVYYNRK